MAGGFFVWLFVWCSTKKTDYVIRVWALHYVRGAWGGLACGIFGTAAVGGLGNASFIAQLIGTIVGVAIAVSGGLIVYGLISRKLGIRLSEQEFDGADLSIHHIKANPEG